MLKEKMQKEKSKKVKKNDKKKKQHTPSVGDDLEDIDSSKRLQTIEGLNRIGGSALHYLGWAALYDTASNNRAVAIKSLGQIGEPALDYLGAVIQKDTVANNRMLAINGLINIGKPALGYLSIAARHDEASDNRSRAFQAIQGMLKKQESKDIEKISKNEELTVYFGPSVTIAGLFEEERRDFGTLFFTAGPGVWIRNGDSRWVFNLDGGVGMTFLKKDYYREPKPIGYRPNNTNPISYDTGYLIWMINTRALADLSAPPVGYLGGFSLSLFGTKQEKKDNYDNISNDKKEISNSLFTTANLNLGLHYYDIFTLMVSLGGGLRFMNGETDPILIVSGGIGYFPF